MKKPNNYYCHKEVELENDLSIQYQVIEKIGQGSFGEIYKIFDPATSTIKVLKINKKDQHKVVSLSKENQILQHFSCSDGFAKISKSAQEQDYMIMTFLGENLEKIVQTKPMSIISMKRIAYQLIMRLKQLHLKGYVHRDLKPDNILLGNQQFPHKVYIVDFGLAGSYKKNSKSARKIFSGEIGTIKFCPISSHQGLEQFPKDDLESLIYIFGYLLSKQLPWTSLPKTQNEMEKFKLIKQLKMNLPVEKLSFGVSCLKKYISYVKSLKIEDQIDYNRIMEYFKIDCKEEYCYEFCKPNCPQKAKLMQKQGIIQCIQDDEQTQIGILKHMK